MGLGCVRLQMRSLLGPVFHRVAAAPAIVVLLAIGRCKVTHVSLQERSQVRHASDDVLGQDESAELDFCDRSKIRSLTPTLNSIVPHSTSIVEFPSPKATRWICVNRKIEQMVVNRPRRNRHTTPAFCAGLIFNCIRSGIGKKMIITSQMMVNIARP
jgi:hypothetical protein